MGGSRSFLAPIDEPMGKTAEGTRDFLIPFDTPIVTAGQTVEQIQAQRGGQGFPQQSSGVLGTVGDMFTGNARETRATQELPEIGSEIGIATLLNKSVADVAPISAALLTVTNPKEYVDILQSATDEPVSIANDEAGNIIVNVGGRLGILNKPGFSKSDAMQVGGFGAAFSPAGKAGVGAQNMLWAGIRASSAAGATQTGIEGAQKLSGGEFNPEDIALTSALAGGAEMLFPMMAPFAKALWKRLKGGGQIDDAVRSAARKYAVEIGIDPESLTDDALLALAKKADDAVNPQTPALAGEKEFEIPLTLGQRTLDPKQLSFEDAAKVGTRGDKALNTMTTFREQKQGPAIIAAREMVEDKLSIPSLSKNEAGGTIREGVKAAEKVADDLVKDAYANVGDAGLTVKGLNNLYNATRKAVIGVEWNRALPETASVLEVLKRTQSVISKLQAVGAEIKPTHIKQLEHIRRRIANGIKSADGLDKTQLVMMKRGFDDYMDVAVKDMLFAGDDNALSALKTARGLFREYAKKFRSQARRLPSGKKLADEAGDFVEQLILDDPTNEQIVNAVFGANNFSKGAGDKMATRFLEILGPDSDGWKAIRQQAFMRLLKTTKHNGEDIISGQQTLKAVDNALDNHKTLMNVLFTEPEQQLIRRFAAQVQRTSPQMVKSTENPSGSGVVVQKGFAEIVNRLGHAFAFSGEPILAITASGATRIKSLTNARTAKAAIKPFSNYKPAAPGVVSGAVASGRVLGSTDLPANDRDEP